MKFTYEIAGHVLVLTGILLSLFGMLSNTGLMNLNLPTPVMYVGFVLLIGGMATLYVDGKIVVGNDAPDSLTVYSDGIPDPMLSSCEDQGPLLSDGQSGDGVADKPSVDTDTQDPVFKEGE